VSMRDFNAAMVCELLVVSGTASLTAGGARLDRLTAARRCVKNRLAI